MSYEFEFRAPKPREVQNQAGAGYYDEFLRALEREGSGEWVVIREGVSAAVLHSKLKGKYGKKFEFEFNLDEDPEKPLVGTVFARLRKEDQS